MKKLILVLIIASFSITGNSQEDPKINWMTFEEAVTAQKKNPKKIMIDMFTTWCGPCRMLDKNTFQQKDLVKYVNENYYAVKFNAEGDGEINFKEKKYAASIPYFKAYRKTQPQNIKANFFFALANLEIGDIKVATPLLEEIYTTESEFKEDAIWYLALIKLKTKDELAAKKLLKELNNSKFYSQKAKELSRKL